MQLIVTNTTDSYGTHKVLSPMLGDNIYNPDIQPSECDSILFTLTDTIPAQSLTPLLELYISKLRHGGVMTVLGTDIYQVSLAIVNRSIDVLVANKLIFGGPDISNLHSSLVSINDIVIILEEAGLKITKKALNGVSYVVEAKRD
jgi:hypothetical protein